VGKNMSVGALRFAELLSCTDLPENRPQIFLGRAPALNRSIIIFPGAGLPGKGWPGDYFVQLGEMLTKVSAVTTNQPAMVEMTQPPKSA
jgi:hypothetical protein